MVSVSTPVIVPAPHWVETSEIEAAYEARYSDEPKLKVWLRMLLHTSVQRRPWLAPLQETAAQRGIVARSAAAYEGARDLAVTAATAALERGGWTARSVDALVTTHTTSWTVPGLDVDLVARLGLRPDVSRLGLTTVACAGGAQALIHAVRHVQARPGTRILVVAAEGLSTLHHADTRLTLQTALYGGLFGDAAGAVLVADDVPGAVLEVEDTYELLLPDSTGAYWGVLSPEGLRFDSGREESRRAPGRAVPYVADWLGGGVPVSWAAVHPGSPAVISAALAGMGLDPEVTGRHARASLEGGNLGGVALWDVLARTFEVGPPPEPGAPGVLVAFGPGFTVAALRGRAGAAAPAVEVAPLRP